MGDIVNLRSVRKKAHRQRDEKQADANRIRFGRSKAERTLEAARRAKAGHLLDQHRVETGDEE